VILTFRRGCRRSLWGWVLGWLPVGDPSVIHFRSRQAGVVMNGRVGRGGSRGGGTVEVMIKGMRLRLMLELTNSRTDGVRGNASPRPRTARRWCIRELSRRGSRRSRTGTDTIIIGRNHCTPAALPLTNRPIGNFRSLPGFPDPGGLTLLRK